MLHELETEKFYESVLDDYKEHVNPYLAKLMAFAGFGAEIEAEGCCIVDHEGKQYLDFLGGYGVFSLGHRNPKVVQAVKDQLDKMPLSGKAFFNPVTAQLAKKIASITPNRLQYSFFSNSGAEAVEAAIKLAKGASGKPKIVSTHGSYHGKTLGALSTTGREKYRKPFEPLLPEIHFVDFGSVTQAANIIDKNTACIIVEPIQGEGGINIPPNGYLSDLRKICDDNGAYLIIDEVQTGLGRTGKLFACEYDEVEPDLLTLAKCLGGGVMPIGCTIGTAEIWDKTFGKNPLVHTSTFGGGPMACAAAIAAIEFIESEGLVQKSDQLGKLLLTGLKEVQVKHADLISEVRGRGLMIGTEFAKDEIGELVVAQLLKRGVCVAYTLNNPRVLRWEPPLIVTEEQIQVAIRAFDESVEETRSLLLLLLGEI